MHLLLLMFLTATAALPRFSRETAVTPVLFPRQALYIPNEQINSVAFNLKRPIGGSFFLPNGQQNKAHDPIVVAETATSLPSAALSSLAMSVAVTEPPVPTGQTESVSMPVEVPNDTLIKSADVTLEPLITTTSALSPVFLAQTTQEESSVTKPLPDGNLLPIDKSVDIDGDGLLSLPEVQYAAFVHHGLSGSVVEGMFKMVDLNRDKYLNSTEFNKIRGLVLDKAENAALRYMQSVDLDKNKLLSLAEAQKYLLKEYGIGSRDVERIWKLVINDTNTEMDSMLFAKLRRRIRGMTIRLARQVMKLADTNLDGHISLEEAQAIAFEQEGIGAGDVSQILASVDDNGDAVLNAPEFADFERIVRSKAVETAKKALKVVDADGSGSLTLDEAKRIAFEHYGFDENVLGPFFDQADENEDGQLDAVEFAGFRTVIRSRAVRNAIAALKEIDEDGDGLVSLQEAQLKTKQEDDMEPMETKALFNIADQNKSGQLDKVELADFIRLVRLSAVKFATENFKEFDTNGDHLVSFDEISSLIEAKYGAPREVTQLIFQKVDADRSGDLIPAEIVDFRHEIRHYASEHPIPAQKHLKEAKVGPPTTTSTEDVEATVTVTTHDTQKISTSSELDEGSSTATTQMTDDNDEEEEPKELEESKVTETTKSQIIETTTSAKASSITTSGGPLINIVGGLSQTNTSRQPRIWKHHRPANTIPVVDDDAISQTTQSASTTAPRLITPHGTVTRVDHPTLITSLAPLLEEKEKETTTQKQPPITTTTKKRVTMRRTTRSTTTTTTTTPSKVEEDAEYEIIEVEVDENGNEIVKEDGAKKTATHTDSAKKSSTAEDYEVVEVIEEEENKP